MESTVYRRDSDGKVIGTPEANRLDEQPVFSVSTYRAGEISNTQIQPEIVADKPQPLPVNPEAVKSSPKLPAFKLPKFSFRKSKSRFPRPVRYVRNIVLAYLGFYVVLGFHAASSLDKMPASSNVALADTAGTNWLLVGSDSREGLTKAERKELRTGKDEGSQRTDTIMVINIDDSGKPTLVSLPRDSYITIPAHIALDGSSVCPHTFLSSTGVSFSFMLA